MQYCLTSCLNLLLLLFSTQLYSQQLGFQLGVNEQAKGVHMKHMTEGAQVCNTPKSLSRATTRDSNAKSMFARPSVAFFYGYHAPLPELCTYDLVVIDPYSDFKPGDCQPVSEPIAYVSIGEVGIGAPYEKRINPTWVIGKNPAWNNNKVMDQTNKNWQNFVLDKLVEPLWKEGYKGFFLDTLDSYFLATSTYEGEQKQIAGIAQIIKAIKKRHPDAKIIMNRGFQILPYVHADVHAVAIESLYHGWNNAKGRYEKTSLKDQEMLYKEIAKIRQMNLPIIIIDFLPPSKKEKAPELAKKLVNEGFIPWITNSDLTALYLGSAKPFLREVLLLYTNKQHQEMMFIPIIRYVGSILEYMGYAPKFAEVSDEKTFPKEDLAGKYAGLILWLDTQDTKFESLLNWVKKQIKQQVPVVFLGGFGVPLENRFLDKLQLSLTPIKESIDSLHVSKLDSDFLAFEVQPSKMPNFFFPLEAINSEVLLQLENKYKQTQDAVAITPWGGYALYPYIVQSLPDYYSLWVLNPFTFLKKALRLQDFPIPDATTENGRRLLFIHIDGDGFTNKAKWIGGRYAAEELRDRILKKYQVPTSFSVVTGDLSPDGAYPKLSKETMAIAKDIMALPWIEIASHSFSHPFNWFPEQFSHEKFKREQTYGLTIPGYTMDLNKEITGSVDFINQYLAPPNKKASLFFWTGLANPSPYALELIAKNNLLAINGFTDTIINNQQRSVSSFRPMAVNVGNHYQVTAVFPMDFQYINEFEGPMYGFDQLIQTAHITDTPRRFKPIDVYYHIYAASYPATLQSLINIYEWAKTQPIMHIYASDYIKKVMDFYHIYIGKWHGAWMFFSKGDLRELRSTKALGYPDLLKSTNVIGYNEHNNQRYIHLGPNRLSLLHYMKEKPTVPYLVDANARVAAFSRASAKQLKLTFAGYLPVKFTLGNAIGCKVTSKKPLKTHQCQNNNQRCYSSSEKGIEIFIDCG